MNRSEVRRDAPASGEDEDRRELLALIVEKDGVSAETVIADGALVLEAAQAESSGFLGILGGQSFDTAAFREALLQVLTSIRSLPDLDLSLAQSMVRAFQAEIVDGQIVALNEVLETIAQPVTASATDAAGKLVRQLASSYAALAPSLASKEGAAVSPQVAYALAEEEQDLRDVEAQFGWLDSGGVAEQMGRSRSNRAVASGLRAKGQLLGYARRGQQALRYPKFQFDGKGILPVIPELIRIADENEVAHEDLLLWLCAPTGMLEGDARPVDFLRRDPERVLAAARYDLGGQSW